MKPGTTTRWLLALAFLIGQCFAVVHATTHEIAVNDSPVSCGVCAVAHSPGAAPGVLPPAQVPHSSVAAPIARDVEPILQRAPLHPPSRGPPTSLA